ncbi:MAG: gamma carbonic anhydrase family protein [Deltaproteobacteria bacterium]|jgi:carbonic anhydrase/acetyltransferase-like protein (isoleucine patch superfamily)|nr:gamma carbonic anhydrase family protein [Deltaproteobacteria bacterium]
MILTHKGRKPIIGHNVFIASTAVVIGDVNIKDNSSIWYGSVLRGDLAPITIGESTNIQDNCTIHTDYDKPAVIGNRVTVGHNAVVHGCIVEDNCLIGINSVVLSGARIKTGAVVAAGSLVKQGQVVEPYHLVAGIPAELKKKLPKTTVEKRKQTAEHYIQLAKEHMDIKKAGD